MIVCGGSAYPRDWDYAAFRKVADANGSLLMCDMAHIRCKPFSISPWTPPPTHTAH